MNYYDLLKSFLIGHSTTLDWFGNLFASFIGGIASFIAKVLSIKGNTVVWNQQVDTSTSSVTLTSGHKFATKVNGTYSIVSGTGQSLAVTGGTDEVFDLTKMLGSTLADQIYNMEQSQAGSGVAYFRKLFPLDYYSYESGKLLNFNGEGAKGKNLLNDADSDLVNVPISVYANTDSKLVAQMNGLKEGTYTLTIRYKVDSISEHVTNDFRYGCYVRFTNGGNNINVNLQSDIPNVVVGQEYTKSGTFTLTSEFVGKCTNFWFYCGRSTAQAGNNPDVVTFYHFQLEQGSSATSYEPYTSNVSIKTVGKNKVFKTIEGYQINASGVISVNPSYSVSVAEVRSGETYTITNGDSNLVCAFYTSEPIVGSASYDGTRTVQNSKTITVPINGYIAFRTANGYETPQCEVGSSATAYEPYQSSAKELPISTYNPTGLKQAGSVYDELDFANKKYVKRVGTVDLGTLNWQIGSTNTSGYSRFVAPFDDVAVSSGANVVANITCPKYEANSPNGTYTRNTGISNNISSGQIIVYDPDYAQLTPADFKASVNGVYANYELATPIETAITENLSYKVFSGGTEELLPIDDISTSPFSANIDYPSGNEDVYFTIKESGVFE